ncbi:MAG: hypothetical protein IJY12_05065 [Clostridia bacterium]|nr:hypothetical protein [Clostridia bacterium]
MSELEKLERANYQRKRKSRILFQGIVAMILVAATLIMALTYYRMNKDAYVYYTENGSVEYQVYLKDNGFYDENYLDGEHAYVSALMDSVVSEFRYDLQMDADSVEYKYSYRIDARLEIKDKDSNTPIFDPVYELVSEQTLSVTDRTLSIREKIPLDYGRYDGIAKQFLETYELSNTVSTLIVTLHVNVLSACEEFASDNRGDYEISLRIPLAKEVVNVETVASVSQSEEKVLACTNESKYIYRTLAFVLGGLSAACLIVFGLYVVLTRDKHIDYARRVKKLVGNYRSYIQQINNGFDAEGYQILNVNTFTEMLELRDTLQTPILMYENEDKICTKFIIPTCTKLLYLYEIRVEGLNE